MLDTGLSSPSYTRITEELTTIEIYATDVMIIQIFNPVVAAGYLEHFNLLWKAGRPSILKSETCLYLSLSRYAKSF